MLLLRILGLWTDSEENERDRKIASNIFSFCISHTLRVRLCKGIARTLSLKIHNSELCQNSSECLLVRDGDLPYKKKHLNWMERRVYFITKISNRTKDYSLDVFFFLLSWVTSVKQGKQLLPVGRLLYCFYNIVLEEQN